MKLFIVSHEEGIKNSGFSIQTQRWLFSFSIHITPWNANNIFMVLSVSFDYDLQTDGLTHSKSIWWSDLSWWLSVCQTPTQPLGNIGVRYQIFHAEWLLNIAVRRPSSLINGQWSLLCLCEKYRSEYLIVFSNIQ